MSIGLTSLRQLQRIFETVVPNTEEEQLQDRNSWQAPWTPYRVKMTADSLGWTEEV